MGTVKVDNLVNQSGDQDSGLDLSTNDQILVKTANATRVTVTDAATTVANTLTASTGITVSDGDITMANGHGIDFSATGDGTGSMSSELLDDYEEGTWTATLISGGGITFSGSETNYVKVGRLVYANIACSFSGTSSNRVDISGLPFVSTNTSACTIFHSGGSLPTHGAFLAQSHSGHNRLSGGKGTSDMTYSDVNGTTMRITVTYLASA